MKTVITSYAVQNGRILYVPSSFATQAMRGRKNTLSYAKNSNVEHKTKLTRRALTRLKGDIVLHIGQQQFKNVAK